MVRQATPTPTGAPSVSVLRPGDEEIHYTDNSHRWIGPDPDTDEAWRARVETHVEEHRKQLGNEPSPRRW